MLSFLFFGGPTSSRKFSLVGLLECGAVSRGVAVPKGPAAQRGAPARIFGAPQSRLAASLGVSVST